MHVRVQSNWAVWTSLAGMALLTLVWCELPQTTASAPGPQQLTGHLSKEILAAPIVGRVPGATPMPFEVGLPVRDRARLKKAVRDVSDPRSAHYRHFVTPEQFGIEHGADAAAYEQLVAWARANGLKAKLHPNRLIVSISAGCGSIAAT